MKKSLWQQITKVIANVHVIIGNVDFIYKGPESKHAYLSLDGTIELRFAIKGLDIDKIYVSYLDTLNYQNEATIEITIYQLNPRLYTMDHTESQLESLMVHFKQQWNFKNIITNNVPFNKDK